jgi:signal transduction histidine kinase
MNKFGRILKKGLIVTLIIAYFVGLVYTFHNSSQIAIVYGQPMLPFIIPYVLYASIMALVFSYIKLFLKSNKSEYEFATIVNHSFRTSLTRILWTANELKNTESYTERQNYIQDIENASDRLLSIVDTFLGIIDVRDVSSYVFKAVSIREIVEESLLKHAGLINKKNIQMNVSLFDKMPLLTADLKRISFAVNVLIENALTYTPDGGKITIDCKNQGTNILFYVADSGIGLSMIDKMKVFSKFYRGDRAQALNSYGMGLGLYLSKVIIKRHGGKIYAQSGGTNKGSTFYIELPLNN